MTSPLYLVAYDVKNARRLHKATKIIKDYAYGGQKSAYECYLSKSDKDELKTRMLSALEFEQDSVLLVKLYKDSAVAFLGVAELPPEDGVYYLG
jgi:CRISPR-associated protein Cas2